MVHCTVFNLLDFVVVSHTASGTTLSLSCRASTSTVCRLVLKVVVALTGIKQHVRMPVVIKVAERGPVAVRLWSPS